ncbi:MAG: DNA integrity scanning protein DisA nucleotide-binding domain protein [Clostridia bacterium]|nr:DNA integrity scanning protein DisA nucleotide-binding domain protein [Clostridia bacterium]
MDWNSYYEKLEAFAEGFTGNVLSYVLEFLLFAVLFYYVFKVLQINKSNSFIAIFSTAVVWCGFSFSLSNNISSAFLLIVIIMLATLIFTMYNTEIKRQLLDAKMNKSKGGRPRVDLSGINVVIEEVIKAVQNMSKNDVGALIVLSDDNLPEGIIESGTVVNADITAQMIEAVFYPKAPLHDGAMVVEGNKIYAAGCFLPIAQSDNLPKEMGSRHRAALGVTAVASVTAIVVSEETGIISIVKNGAIRKKYADANDLRNALSDYYWSDITAEAKE